MVARLRLESLENLTLFPKSHNWNKGKNKGKDVEGRKDWQKKGKGRGRDGR